MSESIEITVGPSYVKITPRGRWWHEVILHEPISWMGLECGRWDVFTARWARNKARRVLAAHRRREQRENDRWIIE